MTKSVASFLELLHGQCAGNTEIRVLPGQRRKVGYPKAVFSDNRPELSDFVARQPPGVNVFFGVATRQGKNGTKKGVLEIPALWADIDFKESNEEEAKARVATFKPQPSIIVESGGGLHLYWLLRSPATNDYARIEQILKALAKALSADPAVTEVARVMRLPGTLNYKYDPPRPVRVVQLHPEKKYQLGDFPTLPPQRRRRNPEARPASSGIALESLLAHCKFLAWCKAHPEKVSEPLWFAMLTNVARLPEKGRELCHELSAGYPGYTREETDRKIDHALKDGYGPHTCAWIREHLDCGEDCGVQAPIVLLKRHLQVGSYLVTKEGFFRLKPGRAGQLLPIRLSNFTARVSKEICLDDGWTPPEIEFVVEGEMEGKKLPHARVKSTEFPGLAWVTKTWGIKAWTAAGWGEKDHVRAAIQQESQDVIRSHIYTHTGWRRLEGSWLYLHGAGAIGPEGPVPEIAVEIGPALRGYSLPPRPPQDPTGPLKASLSLLEVARPHLAIPLLSATYLAPLAEELEIDFLLWFYGTTGCFKSSLAALIQSHFGNFDRTTLPGNWSSTANALERRAFTLKDSLFVIDDYPPSPDPVTAKKLRSTADRLIRALGNRAGRQRLGADLKEARTFQPRSLVVSTGELLPVGRSILARLFPLEIKPGDVDLPNLSKAQQQAKEGIFSRAMAAYLQRLAKSLGEGHLARLKARHGELRLRFNASGHSRIPDVLAWLALGWEMFSDFAGEVGVLDGAKKAELNAQAHEVLGAHSHKHARLISDENPARRFIEVLADLIRAGRVRLEPIIDDGDGIAPMSDEEYWPRPDAPAVGWIDKDRKSLFLIPQVAFEAAAKTARGQDEYLGNRTDVFRALAEEGWIQRGAPTRLTSVRRIRGKRIRVLVLKYDAVFPDEAATAEEPPATEER